MSEGTKYKVAVQKSKGPSFDLGEDSFGLEREALDPIGAEIVQIDAQSSAEFIEGARDAEAVIARSRRIHEGIIEGLCDSLADLPAAEGKVALPALHALLDDLGHFSKALDDGLSALKGSWAIKASGCAAWPPTASRPALASTAEPIVTLWT